MRARALTALALAAASSLALAAGPSEKEVVSRIALVPPELMASPHDSGHVDVHVRLLHRNRDAVLESVTYVLKYKRAGKPARTLRPATTALAHCRPLTVCSLLTITDVPLAEAERLKLGVDFTAAKFKLR